MTQSLKDLIAQRDALEKAIADARSNEIAAAVAKVRELIAEYGLTVQDVFPSRATRSNSKVAAKYIDPETKKTWTGRGKAPVWIAGKDREQYLIR